MVWDRTQRWHRLAVYYVRIYIAVVETLREIERPRGGAMWLRRVMVHTILCQSYNGEYRPILGQTGY